jgi:hypothetical protein
MRIQWVGGKESNKNDIQFATAKLKEVSSPAQIIVLALAFHI